MSIFCQKSQTLFNLG